MTFLFSIFFRLWLVTVTVKDTVKYLPDPGRVLLARVQLQYRISVPVPSRSVIAASKTTNRTDQLFGTISSSARVTATSVLASSSLQTFACFLKRQGYAVSWLS